jgi:recombination protein RecA
MAEQTREQALKNVVSNICSQMKDETAIMRLGEESHLNVEGISTGALSLDLALGGKGLPRGRVVEVYGPESSGKTTVALHVIANAQKNGGIAAFIDVEHALDPSWAKRIGVDLESLLVSQPGTAEDALRIAEMLVRSNAVDVIVLDSVAALVPRAEVEGEIGDSHVGIQARLMSQALRILTPAISKTKTCMVFINQIRQKIGVMFGNPETTSGGLALKFYSSVRLEVRKVTTVKDGEDTVGSRVRVKVVKNKIAPPFKQCEFDLMHDRGIAREADLITLAVEEKVLQKSGGNHYYGDLKLGKSGDEAKAYLRDNPKLMDELEQKILEKHRASGKVPGGVVPATPEDETPPTDTPVEAPPPAGRGRRQAATASNNGE